MRRRRLLLASAALVAGSLGGCLGGDDDDDIVFSNPKGCFYDGGLYCGDAAVADAAPDVQIVSADGGDGGTD